MREFSEKSRNGRTSGERFETVHGKKLVESAEML